MKICLNTRAIGLYLMPFIITCVVSTAQAQQGVTAFGIQFKPFMSLDVVNVSDQVFQDPEKNTRLTVQQGFGYAFGAVVRFGLTKRLSLETGINYVQRDYDFILEGNFPTSTSQLQFRNYEIPLLGMVFVQLSDQFFMNAAGGVAFDLYPTGGVVAYDRDTIEYGMLETNWFNVSLLANLGFEYRTKEWGYLYLGASYHRPFSDMAEVYVSYFKPNTNDFNSLMEPQPGLSGSYLSIDIRYFFNPGDSKKKKKKKE